MQPDQLILFGILVFAYGTQAMTGFGSNVIAVTMAAAFLSFTNIVPLVIMLNLFMIGYLFFRYWKEVDFKLIGTLMWPAFVFGMPAGFAIFHFFSFDYLRYPFIVMVTFISVRGFWRLQNKEAGVDKAPSPLWLYLAAVTHGMFGTGGPFLVYYMARLELDKLSFRTQLSGIWLMLNSALMLGYIARGQVGIDLVKQAALLSPSIVVGLVVGEYLQRKVPQEAFLKFVYVLLFVFSILMLFK